MKKILVVSAHPDDEVVGMGGTLKKLSRVAEIQVLFLADGITARKKTGYVNSSVYEVSDKESKKMLKEIETRKAHAKNALSLLGIKKMRFLDLPDNELDTVPLLKIVKEVEKDISSSKCDTIFTHHYNDLNVDHRIAYDATLTAARPIFDSSVESIISFESISSTDWRKPYKFDPNLYVDITTELKQKLKAARAYKNEIQNFPHPRSVKAIESLAFRWGSLSGFKAAEAFEIILSRIKKI